MIRIKVLKPRTGLISKSRGRISITLGLALVTALKRVYDFEVKGACTLRELWTWHASVVS
jgi:hypothetical protein